MTMLVTSEMVLNGVIPVLFTGGACNIQTPEGVMRNPGRDELAAWLDEKALTYFDPQIHPSTHGREYVWGVDAPQEKKIRKQALLRIYEVIPETIAGVSMMEVMDDARHGRCSIVWFHGRREFVPPGLGDRDALRANTQLREQVGNMVFEHLLAYIHSGLRLRNELQAMLEDCDHIVLVDSFEELKNSIQILLKRQGHQDTT
jgi:hypothetical protein